jgi:hypothetical protein
MAANPYIFYSKKLKKNYDVSFFGQHYGERGYWLKEIKSFCLTNKIKFHFPVGDGVNVPWSYDSINDLYNQTKINISFAPMELPGRIVNLRTFEIAISGNFQLMQYTPCVEEYFEIDKEIVCWKNKKELFEKIQYYLENEDERERIAKNGYNKAKNEHTWTKRFEIIEKILKKKDFEIEVPKIHINKELENNKIDKNQILTSENKLKRAFELSQLILKKRGYNLRRDLRLKRIMSIITFKFYHGVLYSVKTFNYKPDLENFLFIEFQGKIMMIIKITSSNLSLNTGDWEDLIKKLYLTENRDLSLPEFGALTNGIEWIIRDFKNEKWLRSIPNRKFLLSRANLKGYILIEIIEKIKNYYRLFKLTKILPAFIKKSLKLNYININSKMRNDIYKRDIYIFLPQILKEKKYNWQKL